MTAEILGLEDARRGDAAVVGGKAANLGELIANGFPVPPGFVVTAAAYRRFATAAGLDPLVVALTAAPRPEADPLRTAVVERIRSAAVPDDLARAIVAAYRALLPRGNADELCVVRSSGTAEDLAGASFAGQHGTYYYVDEARLLPMIRSCWASLWSEAVVSYRTAHGMDHGAAQMAVIVQRQIPAEMSGVTFTANPVTGATSEIVIEASWGMGAAIVDGRVTPDRYVFARDELVLKERKLSRKRFRVSTTMRAGPEGQLLDVPLEQQHAGTLPDELARSVAALALRAERHFGAPQDVEWAIARGELYLLQSRPITAAGRKPFCRNARGGKYVLFKAVVENFTDPLTPLTLSLWLQGLVFGIPLVVIGGRLYFDVAKLRRLFPFRLTDQEVAQLIYLSTDGVRPRLTLAVTRLPVPALFAGLILLLYANVYARTAHLPADFMDGFRRFAGSVDRDARYGPREAMRELFLGTSLWQRLVAPVGHQVLLVNTSAARYMAWFGVLKRLLARWLPDAGPEALGLLASGGPGMLSAEMGRRLQGLALEARQSDATRRLLLERPPEQVLPVLRRTPEAANFVRELDAFLATFGHRALKEFEFKAPRWEEDPVPVLGMIRNCLLADVRLADHDRRAADKRAELDRAMERALGVRKHILRWVAGRVRYLATMRENSRFYWVLAAYVVRKKILRLEETLIAQGRLKCKDDIFFLEWPEVEQLRTGRLGWADVESRIGQRRREYVRLSKVTPPKVIGIERSPGEPAVVEAEAGTMLRGQSASAGRHEGLARVILDPEHNVELRHGEVLVAPYTDPAWTPLFLTAGAAVVEVGSFLSHAGTVAREYGLPCVVDVAECTTRIRTGDRVVVDGDAGVVHVVASAEAG